MLTYFGDLCFFFLNGVFCDYDMTALMFMSTIPTVKRLVFFWFVYIVWSADYIYLLLLDIRSIFHEK
jgi:hypothetical protein